MIGIYISGWDWTTRQADLKMSNADRIKWEKKYAGSEALSQVQPDEELLACRLVLPCSGQALDLACGLGKNSLYLAQRGLQVTALDVSVQGLDKLSQAAQKLGLGSRISPVLADLDDYELKASSFDVIVVVRFLNRDLFAAIRDAIRPGGVLLYKTFNRRILEQRPGFNPDFTIETDELIRAFAGLNILRANREDTQSEYAYILARKPGKTKE